MTLYVSGFMYSPGHKKVVLIQKKKPAWQEGLLNGVGGKIENGETPEMAMAREFKEETGVSTPPEAWKVFSTITGEGKYKIYFLSATHSDYIHAQTIEAEEVGIYEVDALPDHVIHNLKWLIPMSLDRKLSFQEPVCVKEHV